MRKSLWSGFLCVSMLALAACAPQGDPFGSGLFEKDSPTVGTGTGGSTSAPIVPAAPGEQPPATAGASNQAPIIENFPPTSVQAGNFYEFTVQASDPDSTKLWYTARGLPDWMTLDRDSGRLSGTPFNEDAGATADITLIVTDGTTDTALPVFHITVVPMLPPTPPPAPDNQAPIISGTPPTGVMATLDYEFVPSASDADSAVLTWSIANKPSWASFSSTTGRLSGTPGRTQTGVDSNIIISVFDGSLSASLPAFSIGVSAAPNAAPAINGTPATSVQAGSAYSFTPSAWDEDGDALFFQITGMPSWASFNEANGTLSGTPNASQAGTYPNIVIWANDGKSPTPMQAFSITVASPANGAPVISGSPTTAVQAGTPYSFAPSASDPEGGTLRYAIANQPSWANFDTNTGQISGTPNASQVGTYPNIVITVSDGTDSVSLPAFGITVSAVPVTNQPPSISGTPSNAVQAGTAYSFMPSASDLDGNPISYSIANRPTWANFNNTTGQLWGTPDTSDVGTYSNIVISVSDGTDSTSLPAFGITVSAPPVVNRPPSISGAPSTAVQAGTAYSFDPSASDPESNALSYAIVNRPSWANFNPGTGQLSGTPNASQVGTYPNIVISVSDGTNSAALPAFSITVGSAPVINNPPSISGSPASTVQADSGYSFTPAASDADRDPLFFSISNRPSWANFNNTTGQLWGTPNASEVGTYSNIVISVSDGSVSTALPAFGITVSAPPVTNRPPSISGSPSTGVQTGSAYSFVPNASDPDGNTLSYSIANRPAWANFNNSTGQLWGTPNASQAGTYSNIVISVSDGTASAALPAFTITVSTPPVVNNPPTISGTPSTTVQAGAAYSFTPGASDPEGNPLTFSIAGRPAWASFNASNGSLTGTPNASQAGSYGGIVITVSDGTNSRSLAAFTITVTAPVSNGTATLSWGAPTTNTDGSALTDLAGYRLYHGTSASDLSDVRTVASPGITTFVFDQLGSGTHYFAITAYNSSGIESPRSAVENKTIP